MVDFPIVDSHIHLLEPARFGYAWTKSAPSLERRVLPSDLTKAAKPFVVDRFVFVEVDVDFPQHLAEASKAYRILKSASDLGANAAHPFSVVEYALNCP